MSHHSPESDLELDAKLRRFLEKAGEPLGKTGQHPRGRLTPTDEGGIRVAVGSKNGAVVIDFGTPCAWIGFSPDEARQIAVSLMKHADHLDGKATAGPESSGGQRCRSGTRCEARNPEGTQCSVVLPPHPGDHAFATTLPTERGGEE